MSFIVCMGVSGSGKSTIGKLLAAELHLDFYDGDDFHPDRNVQKMRSGQALTDEDRESWLLVLRELIIEKSEGVLACSALKSSYRSVLRGGAEIVLIYLHGGRDLLLKRISQRRNHFMPASLLESQLDDLEPPKSAIHVNIEMSPSECVSEIMNQLDYGV